MLAGVVIPPTGTLDMVKDTGVPALTGLPYRSRTVTTRGLANVRVPSPLCPSPLVEPMLDAAALSTVTAQGNTYCGLGLAYSSATDKYPAPVFMSGVTFAKAVRFTTPVLPSVKLTFVGVPKGKNALPIYGELIPTELNPENIRLFTPT